jgi:hypothetical protein
MLKGRKVKQGALLENAKGIWQVQVGNKLQGKPLRWCGSPGEDAQGMCRLIPSRLALENPKGQGTPRPKGENVSHARSRELNKSFEGHANHESGRFEAVTNSNLPVVWSSCFLYHKT